MMISVVIFIFGFIFVIMMLMLCSCYLKMLGSEKGGCLYYFLENGFNKLIVFYDWILKMVLDNKLFVLVVFFFMFVLIGVFFKMVFKGFMFSEDIG